MVIAELPVGATTDHRALGGARQAGHQHVKVAVKQIRPLPCPRRTGPARRPGAGHSCPDTSTYFSMNRVNWKGFRGAGGVTKSSQVAGYEHDTPRSRAPSIS